MNSILYENALLEDNKKLVTILVDKLVCWSEQHKRNCVTKIIAKIQEQEWQYMYPNRVFIFSIYHALDIRIWDIKTMLSCQSLDLIYHFLCIHTKLTENTKFNLKFQTVFSFYHSDIEISEEAIELMRIIRNNIAHTWLIEWVDSKLKDSERNSIEIFVKEFHFHSVHHALHSFAAEFDYLMEDIILRILGLWWEDLWFNLRPPSRSDYFIKK